MTKEQRDLLIELVRVERRRLNNAKRLTYVSYHENDELNKEIKLCNETLKSLEGGK
jgi:hypothetical protein|tara:strand:- start:463 stop:630 length:168 start_codon:yes stop_codon:yes gene_type:complete